MDEFDEMSPSIVDIFNTLCADCFVCRLCLVKKKLVEKKKASPFFLGSGENTKKVFKIKNKIKNCGYI